MDNKKNNIAALSKVSKVIVKQDGTLGILEKSVKYSGVSPIVIDNTNLIISIDNGENIAYLNKANTFSSNVFQIFSGLVYFKQIVDLGSKRINNLATPTEPKDAANKEYVDSEGAKLKVLIDGKPDKSYVDGEDTKLKALIDEKASLIRNNTFNGLNVFTNNSDGKINIKGEKNSSNVELANWVSFLQSDGTTREGILGKFSSANNSFGLHSEGELVLSGNGKGIVYVNNLIVLQLSNTGTDFCNLKGSNLATPTLPKDAANKEYVDAHNFNILSTPTIIPGKKYLGLQVYALSVNRGTIGQITLDANIGDKGFIVNYTILRKKNDNTWSPQSNVPGSIELFISTTHQLLFGMATQTGFLNEAQITVEYTKSV